MLDGRHKGELNVSTPGHDCERKVMTMDAVPFPFSSRNARYVKSMKRLGYLLWVFLQSVTGFYIRLIRENASRPCFPFLRIPAQDRYSLLPITRMFKLVRISNFSNLVF